MATEDGKLEKREWRQNDKIFRADGKPHVEYSNGTKEWLNEKGQRHRDDGPAVIYADGTQEWWQNGRLYKKEDSRTK